MSFQLTFGGGETLFVKNKGTANAVQGFVSSETVVSGNITALPTNFLFQLYSYIQIPLNPLTANIVWIKVSGVWKQATVWIKESGVWKTATPNIKVSGQWK